MQKMDKKNCFVIENKFSLPQKAMPYLKKIDKKI